MVKILLSYSNFSVEKTDSPGYHTLGRLTRQGIISEESCFGRFFIDSLGYDIPGRLTRRGMIPGEIDSPGNDTPGRLTRRGMIPLGDGLAGG